MSEVLDCHRKCGLPDRGTFSIGESLCKGTKFRQNPESLTRKTIRQLNIVLSLVYAVVAIIVVVATRKISRLALCDIPSSFRHPIKCHCGSSDSITYIVIPAKAVILMCILALLSGCAFHAILALDLAKTYTSLLMVNEPLLLKWVVAAFIFLVLTLAVAFVSGVVDLLNLTLVCAMSVVAIMGLLWAEMTGGVIGAYSTTVFSFVIIAVCLYFSLNCRIADGRSRLCPEQKAWRLVTLHLYSVLMIAMVVASAFSIRLSAASSDLIMSLVMALGVIAITLAIAFGFESEI